MKINNKIKNILRMNKKIKVKCGMCKGTGQSTEWQKDGIWFVEDCPDCNGEGEITVIVIDKRIKSKSEEMDVPYST